MDFADKKSVFYNKSRVRDRNIDELLGIIKGLIADDAIVQKEAEFLQTWIKNNFSKNDLDSYPIKQIYDRLEEMLKDNILNNKEKEELLELLRKVSGGKPIAENIKNMSTSLPLDNPPPPVYFKDMNFVLTGTFTIGTRSQVTKILEELGAKVKRDVSGVTNYLVIGILGNEDWIHSSYGRKIEKAVEYNQKKGCNIKIISEEHLIQFL